DLLYSDRANSLAKLPADADGQVLTLSSRLPSREDNIDTSILVQQVRVESTSYGSTTTVIPTDDPITQHTKGSDVFTLAITPANSANILVIEIIIQLASDGISGVSSAIFVDSPADAITATNMTTPAAGYNMPVVQTYYVLAGSTSSRTYKLR